MLERVFPEQARVKKATNVRCMQDTLMAEPLVLVSLLLITSLLLWLLADSDDDNSGGGLRQPVLVPIPVRRNQH
jgi:hypothetical protein